jgi:hypothetical protein
METVWHNRLIFAFGCVIMNYHPIPMPACISKSAVRRRGRRLREPVETKNETLYGFCFPANEDKSNV